MGLRGADLFVDVSQASSNKEAKSQLVQGCCEHGVKFSNSFLLSVGHAAGRASEGIQGNLKLWKRLVKSKKVGDEGQRSEQEERPARFSGVAGMRGWEIPEGFQAVVRVCMDLSWLLLLSQSSFQDSLPFVIFQPQGCSPTIS